MKIDEFSVFCADDDPKKARYNKWFSQTVYVTIAIFGYLLFAAVTILHFRIKYTQPVFEFIGSGPCICDSNSKSL